MRLTALVLGSDQERALRRAASAAVQLTAQELCPDDDEQAEQLAMVISQVFSGPVLSAPVGGQVTLMEVLQTGISRQLAVLDDVSLTGTEESSAEALGLLAATLADSLTGHLVGEILLRGAGGGPLAPLAAELNHEMTHLQVRRLEGMLGPLAEQVKEALALLGSTRTVAAAPLALAQLPAVTGGFTGRDEELTLLTGLLDPAGTAGSVVISAVSGLAGVGKTALAVQAGHAARERGWFSGGVLFIDLHGYDKAPVEPGQALEALLRALLRASRISAEHIPPGAEEQAGLYRSVLSDTDGPVLVIADNASSEAQVRLLLPGTGPHKVVVTSRHTLAGLGARLIDVTVLDEQAAVDLLAGVLCAARPEDDRVTGDAARRLAGMCGRLPLALRIAGALLTADPALGVAELADELTVEQVRLERLRYDDGSGPGGLSVTAAFELSCQKLEEIPARVFRLLPVNPGPDLSAAAAAALADLPVTEVRQVLAGLGRAHLLEAAPGTAGQWRMHDLLRLYAGRLSDDHADADDREEARDRLLDYYLSTAGAANQHLLGGPDMAAAGQFNGRDSALAWFDAERPNLVAAIGMAADTGRDQVAQELPFRLGAYLDWRRRFDDWVTVTAISVNAARRLGNRHREGEALNNLGLALRNTGRFDEAISAHEDAVAIHRETVDRHGEGMALNNLGVALQEARRFSEAITAHQDAAAIDLETGHRHSEGTALNNLGVALRKAGRFDGAMTAHRAAVAIHRETGDRHSEGGALNNLGVALQEVRRFDEAITAHQEDFAICRETGDRHGAGTALNDLGVALRKAGRFDEAITAHRAAAVIYRETGDWHSENNALGNLETAQAARQA